MEDALAQAIRSLAPRDRAHLQAVAAFAQRAPWDGVERRKTMTTVTFDTLKYAKALKDPGVPDVSHP